MIQESRARPAVRSAPIQSSLIRLLEVAGPHAGLLHKMRAMKSDASYQLPNGMQISYTNRNEAAYLYDEIFEQRQYVPTDYVMPDRPVVVDVGANVGLFALFALTEFQSAHVVCMEPFTQLYHILNSNVSRFPAAQALRVAAGRTRETATFTYYPKYSMMSGRYCDEARDLARAKKYARWEMRDQSKEGIDDFEGMLDALLKPRFQSFREEVEIWPLSLVIERCQLQSVDLLKIDVEGSELEVLEGINHEDWEKIGCIIIEVDDVAGRLSAITSLLMSHDMECKTSQFEAYSDDTLHLIQASQRQ